MTDLQQFQLYIVLAQCVFVVIGLIGYSKSKKK
jgi:hypothetical protein